MPDENLLDFIRAGNIRAYEALVNRHHKRFYATTYRWVMHSEDAEDIVQDAFLKLWSGKAVFKAKKGARFTTWFYRILYNQAMDVLRKRKRSTSEIIDNLPSMDESQEEVQHFKEQQTQLRHILNELPEKQRIAVQMFYFEDMPQKDIASMMGLSLKALESQLSRAKVTLRERMKSYA